MGSRASRIAGALAAVVAASALAAAGTGSAKTTNPLCAPASAPGSEGVAPVVTGEQTVSTTGIGARITATITTNQCPTRYTVQYGDTAALSESSPVRTIAGSTVPTTVSITLSDLNPSTIYYYRVIATSGPGLGVGDVNTLTTTQDCSPGNAPVPSATTGAATHTRATHAVLNGTATPNGCPFTYVFEYGPGVPSAGAAPTYPDATSPRTVRTSPSARTVSMGVTGLDPNTTYHFRLVVTTGAGTSDGDDETFTTPPTCGDGDPAPTVTTSPAIHVNATHAELTGTITANGCPGTYFFTYGPTAAYGSSTPVREINANATDKEITWQISHLTVGAAYHFRLHATSFAGTATGADVVFTTSEASPAAAQAGAATGGASNVTANAARLTGMVPATTSTTVYFFAFGQTRLYNHRSPLGVTGASNRRRTLRITVSRLRPHTTYHYRLVVVTSGKVMYGRDREFTTAAATTLKVTSSDLAIRRGYVLHVRVTCTGAAGSVCHGTVAILAGRLTLARAAVQLRRGRHATLRLKLDTQGVLLLSRRHSLSAVARTTVRNGASVGIRIRLIRDFAVP